MMAANIEFKDSRKREGFDKPCGLEEIDDLAFQLILENLSMRARKNLRQVNKSMKLRVDMLDKDISILTARSPTGLNHVMKCQHVKKVNLKLSEKCYRDETVDMAILRCGNLLKSLQLSRLDYRGGNFDVNTAALDSLDSLKIFHCSSLSGLGISQLLQLSSKSLTTLDIESETQSLPKILPFQMIKLANLALVHVEFTEEEIKNLLMSVGTQLRTLEIKYTNVTGESLEDFPKNFEKLEYLKLRYNNITIKGLKELIRITAVSMKTLDISEDGVNEDASEGFAGELRQLEYLDVCHSEFTAQGLAALLSITGPKLKSLKLPYNQSLSEFPILQYPKNLNLKVTMYFGGEQIQETDFNRLLQVFGSHMISLNLDFTRIIQAGLLDFPMAMPNLMKIHCTHKETNDSILTGLLGISIPNLNQLVLNRTQITGNALQGSNGKFPNLSRLEMSGCKMLSDQGFCALLGMCGHQLHHLDLSNTNVSGEGLEKLTLSFPKLVQLNLTSTNFTDQGLACLLNASGYKLKRLYLQETKITGEMSTGKTVRLSHLSLAGCKQLTDKGLLNLLKNWQNLKSLDLSCTNITGTGLALANHQLCFTWLQKLELRGCKQLTSQGLCEIISISRSSIKHLDLSRIKISGEELAGREMSIPNLNHLDLTCCKTLTADGLYEVLRFFGSTLQNLILDGTNVGNIFPFDSLNRTTKLLPNLRRLKVGLGPKSDYSFTTLYLNYLLRTTDGKLRQLKVSRCYAVFESKYAPNCKIDFHR